MRQNYMLYSHEQLYIHICIHMQNRNDYTIKTSEHSSLEKCTSNFIWKGSKGLRKVLPWEGVGDRTELQHIDPHSYGHNSVSFPFSWAAQQASLGHGPHSSISPTDLISDCSIRGPEGPLCWMLFFSYRILSPTDWTSCAPSYIIVRRPPCGRHKKHSFNPSTVKFIFWYSSSGYTCYLHRCISYFDCPTGSEVNIQHIQVVSK